LSLLKSEKRYDTKEKIVSSTSGFHKVISIVAAIVSLVLAYLTFIKNDKIDDLEARNKLLMEQVESLKKEVKKGAITKPRDDPFTQETQIPSLK